MASNRPFHAWSVWWVWVCAPALIPNEKNEVRRKPMSRDNFRVNIFLHFYYLFWWSIFILWARVTAAMARKHTSRLPCAAIHTQNHNNLLHFYFGFYDYYYYYCCRCSMPSAANEKKRKRKRNHTQNKNSNSKKNFFVHSIELVWCVVVRARRDVCGWSETESERRRARTHQFNNKIKRKRRKLYYIIMMMSMMMMMYGNKLADDVVRYGAADSVHVSFILYYSSSGTPLLLLLPRADCVLWTGKNEQNGVKCVGCASDAILYKMMCTKRTTNEL